MLRALLVLTLLLSAVTARAEQHELSIGLQPLYGLTYIDQRSPSGGGGNLHLAYGLTDAVALLLSGGATVHGLSALKDDSQQLDLPAGTLLTWQAGAGVVYALDVVRIVPFFEASLGVLGTKTFSGGQVTSSIGAAAALGLGADYMISRRWAVGVAVRYHAFLTDLSHIPVYLTVGPRVVLRFGL